MRGQRWLDVRVGGQPPQRVPVGGQTIRIGRMPGNGIVLPDRFVSGQHAELVVQADALAVRDLGSSNGTRLNGQPLAPGVLHLLRDGDTLQIGESTLTVHVADVPSGPAPSPTPARPSGPAPSPTPARPSGPRQRSPAPAPAPAPARAVPPARQGRSARQGRLAIVLLRRALPRLVLALVILGMLIAGGVWLLAPARVSLLVLGSDARPDELQHGMAGRTDTLLLVVADRELDGLTMISIPRDLWVSIPGYGEERINAAYPLGGAVTAERAVGDVLGVPVGRSLAIGLQGVRDVVDAAGGVEIDVPQPIHDAAYPTDDYGIMVLDIPAGRQWMDGETALRYARTRHQDSDFGRMARQQQVISALRARLLQPLNWWRIPAVMLAARRAAQTNVGLADLATLGLVVAHGDGPVRLTPDFGLVEEFRGRDGAYLLRARPALKQRVGVVLAPATAGVEVLNGSLTEGVARQAADTLRNGGIRVVSVGNAARPRPETTVEVCGGCLRAGQRVAGMLGAPASAVIESAALPPGVDVRVTVGMSSR
ncbi:MAG: LCP family protein [Chloroflexi bacterium]|nr:LCP family protein [Chloroflexota bacterium]